MTRPLALALTVSAAAVLSATQARPADEVTRVVFAVNDRGEPVTDLRPEELSAVTTTATLQLVNLQSAGAAAASDGRMVGVVIDDLHVLPAETPLLRETLRVIRDQFWSRPIS